MKVMKDPGDFLPSGAGARQPSTPEQIEEMKRLMDAGFRQGAVAAGFGMVYTPAASRWEILEMFRLAAKYRASCHVHLRGGSTRDDIGTGGGTRGGNRGGGRHGCAVASGPHQLQCPQSRAANAANSARGARPRVST